MSLTNLQQFYLAQMGIHSWQLRAASTNNENEVCFDVTSQSRLLFIVEGSKSHANEVRQLLENIALGVGLATSEIGLITFKYNKNLRIDNYVDEVARKLRSLNIKRCVIFQSGSDELFVKKLKQSTSGLFLMINIESSIERFRRYAALKRKLFLALVGNDI